MRKIRNIDAEIRDFDAQIRYDVVEGNVMTMCAFVQWPEGLCSVGPEWDAVCRDVRTSMPDILVTNEMPFGSWLAKSRRFDAHAAWASVAAHEAGVIALKALKIPIVISSRPVWAKNKLMNEAISIVGDDVRVLHRKQVSHRKKDGTKESGSIMMEGTLLFLKSET